MSKFNYIGSYSKSSSVQFSVISGQIFQPSRTLALAKGSSVEFYKLCEDHLEHFKDQEFFSYIHSLAVLPGQTTESILVLTHQHHLFQYFSDTKIIQISLKLVTNPKNAKKFFMKPNRFNTLLCIHDYSKYFRVFKVNNGKIIEDGSLLIDNIGGDVRDIEFVNGGTVLVVLSLGGNYKETLVNFYNTANGGIGEKRMFKFLECPGKLLTLPTDNLILLLTNTSYRLIDTIEIAELSQENEEFGQITAKCSIDNTRWIFSNIYGKYFVIIFGPIIEVKRLGASIAAAGIVHLDKNLFFLAGFENLSRVIELKLEENKLNLEEGKIFSGVCCVNDFQLLDQNDIGEFNFLIASGSRLFSGITKAFKSIMTNIISDNEISNINGAWSLKLNSEWDSYFVLSILSSSKVLYCPDSDLTLVNFPEFHSNESTFTIFVYENSIIHVSPSGIFRYGELWNLVFTKLTSEITSSSIIFATGFCNTLVLAMQDCSVFCFEITKNSILQIWMKKFQEEISCIQCNENFVAVSFWESNSYEIFEKYSGNKKFEDLKKLMATAKSMKFINFEEVSYLFIGLRNGVLVYVNLTSLESKKLTLGVHDVIVEEIQFKTKNFILAASDSSIILYLHRGKITHSSLSVQKIQVASGFNTPSFPDCMLVAQKDRLLILNYEDLSKHSYDEQILSQTIIQLHQLSDFYLLACQDISGRSYIKTFSFEFSELSSVALSPSDHFIGFEVVKNNLFVGCTSIDKEKLVDLSGSIKVFSLNNQKLLLIDDLHIEKPITVLKQWQDFLIIGGENLSLFQISGSLLKIVESVKTRGKVESIDTNNNLIATVCIRDYLSIYTFAQDKLMNLYRYNQMDSGKVVKFIDGKHILVGDSNCNICVFELSGTFINLISGFNFEIKVPHKLIQMEIPEQVYGFTGICTALSTRTGNIYTIFSIPEDTYVILSTLQNLLTKYFQHFDKFLESVWQVKRRGLVKDVNCFINGDFLAKFESLQIDQQKVLAQQVSKKTGKFVNEETLNDLIYSLNRIH